MTEKHAQNLEFYTCTFDNDDHISYVTADLNLKASAPQNERPLLLRIEIPLLKPKDNGLPQREESSRLYALEDKITAVLQAGENAVLAGMIWWNGLRRLYYYCKSSFDAAGTVESLGSEFPPHQYSIEIIEDPEWEVFLEELYPNGLGLQYIRDRHTVDTLKKNGDVLTAPREVRHWSYFPSEISRAEFIARIEEKGFARMAVSRSEEDQLPFVVSFSRTDSVTFESVQGFTQDLWILADGLGGQYDGWECQVTVG